MSRHDEKLRSLSRRIKGHIEVWEHLGMGRLNCSVVNMCSI
jgi:hypothetical protein